MCPGERLFRAAAPVFLLQNSRDVSSGRRLGLVLIDVNQALSSTLDLARPWNLLL